MRGAILIRQIWPTKCVRGSSAAENTRLLFDELRVSKGRNVLADYTRFLLDILRRKHL